MNFGEKLRELVKEKGISQKELAERLGVSPASVNQYFSSNEPSIGTVFRICEACGTKAWTFIAHTETNIPTYMFELIEEIGKLSPEKQNIILKGLKPLVELAVENKK